MNDQAVLRLAPGVSVVRRQAALLLHSHRTGQTVRVSAAALPLLDGLRHGTNLPALVQQMQAAHPQAQQVQPKVEAFLMPLRNSGMLADEAAPPVRRRAWPPRLVLRNPDAWVVPIARGLLVVPAVVRRMVLAALLIGSITMLWQLAAIGAWPGLRATLEHFDARGLLVFAIVVLLHECGHAVACRMAGAPVRGAGIVWHGGVVPGPFVDTSHASTLGSRWARGVIPAVGPLTNLIGAAACAVVLLNGWGDAAWVPAWRSAFVLCMAFVAFDLNPFAGSDGSHVLEAVLDDELARQVALRPQGRTLTAARTVWLYRAACIAWLAMSAGLFVWWW